MRWRGHGPEANFDHALFLGEQLSPTNLLGVALIGCGAVLVAL